MKKLVYIYENGKGEITEHEDIKNDDVLNAACYLLHNVIFGWMIDEKLTPKEKEYLLDYTFKVLTFMFKETYKEFLPQDIDPSQVN